MTEPTDAEIFVVAREAGLLPDNSHPAPETRAARKHSNAVQAFARAVLTKWGTPPVVAGEPVAYRHMHDDGWEYYDAPTGSDCPGCAPCRGIAHWGRCSGRQRLATPILSRDSRRCGGG